MDTNPVFHSGTEIFQSALLQQAFGPVKIVLTYESRVRLCDTTILGVFVPIFSLRELFDVNAGRSTRTKTWHIEHVELPSVALSE